ncbi:unnamed protein product [Nippostrongylus brasiliensis]|uniref:Secreted protein n=1 Tax=Nippostrongylus brasiliensis TaxID=27835 RepID=A0A0N4YV71_NIPBR|nr:unnamed protein product [Nippostrongylus brasiliensis]
MIAIICMVLAAVTAVFFGCYFFLRFIHRALGSDERKDSDVTALPYSNVVIHSKRVYEIQAEEGCFTGPPDIHEPAEPSKSQSSDDHQSIGSNECSRQGSLKKPETGDLKAIRLEHECDDPRQIMRKKERKVSPQGFGLCIPVQARTRTEDDLSRMACSLATDRH